MGPLIKECERCEKTFEADPRLGKRQRVCVREACRQWLAEENKRQWLESNRDYYAGAAGHLNLDRLPFAGDITTYAVEENDPNVPDYVPDSASTATAWSAGKKTSDRRIGTTAGTDKPLENIIELAQRKGLRVGNVTTADITDATPAAAAAHVSHRKCTGP